MVEKLNLSLGQTLHKFTFKVKEILCILTYDSLHFDLFIIGLIKLGLSQKKKRKIRKTLRKIMLGNIKVIGMSEKEPSKLTKSLMKGNAAVTNMLNEKKTARNRNKRVKFSFSCIPFSVSRNLVSNIS